MTSNLRNEPILQVDPNLLIEEPPENDLEKIIIHLILFSLKAYQNHYYFVYENSFHRNIGGIFDHSNQSSLLKPLKIFNKYLIK